METISAICRVPRHMAWAKKQKILSRLENALLVTLYSYAGGKHYCWPSLAALADESGYCERSVSNALAGLERAGFILRASVRLRRTGKPHRVYVYLDHPAIPAQQKQIVFVSSRDIRDIVDPDKVAPSCAPATDTTGQPMTMVHAARSQKLPFSSAEFAGHVYNKNVLKESPLTPKTETFVSVSVSGKSGDDFKSILAGSSVPIPQGDMPHIIQDSTWLAAKNKICESQPHLRPLLNQLIGQLEGDGSLCLAGPNGVITGIIERQHGQRIAEALLQANVSHRFGIQSDALRCQIEARDQALEFRERTNAAMQARQAQQARERNMERLTPAEQFDVLAREYPSQNGLWWAKRTFLQMAKRNEIPSLPVMLSAIRRQKANPSWQRDCGRWVPHLSNWFTRHCWEDA